MQESTIAWETLISHLPRNAALCRGILGEFVLGSGSGPWEESEYDKFLKRCGVIPYPLDTEGPSVLVIGHTDWDKDELDSAIETRAGKSLRVYSQEMVLVSLALGADVFDICDKEQLIVFGEGHPALQYLMEDWGFDWPTTEVTISKSSRVVVDFGGFESPETGLL